MPDYLSLKTYLVSAVEVASSVDDEIYYPDYDATGTTVNETEENVVQGESKTDLSEFITSENSTNTNSSETTYSYNVTDNSYFYNQLDVYGKTIYSQLYANLDNMKSGTYTIDFGTTFNELLQTDSGEQTLTDSFQLSINALLLDHPEIFYLDVTKIYMYTEITKNIAGSTYRISIGPDENGNYLESGFYSESDVLIAETQIEYVLDDIVENLSGSIYNQIKQIHNYLIDNTTYDSDSSEMSHNIYGTLVNNLAVCDGYSKSFKYILDNIGISCVVVCGIGENSSGEVENHAWNDVLIDENWYAIDVTWDDPIIVGGRGVLTDELRYNYFLKGSTNFYSSHTEDGYIVDNGSFTYPILSSNDY